MRNRSIFIILIWSGVLWAAFLAQPAANADWTVLPGYDLFTTDSSGTSFPGLGSLAGVPLGTYNFGSGSVSVGNADTIIQRLDTVSVAETAGSTGTTALKVDALQLVTTSQVSFDGGPTGYYYVTLDATQPTDSTMTIEFNSSHGGTFASSLDITIDIRYGSLTGTIVDTTTILLTQGDLSTGAGDAWGRFGPAGAEKINGVNHHLNGRNDGNDFWPAPLTEMHYGGGSHMVDPASVPEPSTGMLATLAAAFGLGCAGWNRWRRA